AVLVDAHLVSVGQQAPRAARIALALASALLARETRASEFYSRRAALSGASTAALCSKILDAYEQLLVIQGNESLDIDPGPASPERPAWRARHRALLLVIGRDGCEETAREIARSIPDGLWTSMENSPSDG